VRDFENRFGPTPTGEHTFYPVRFGIRRAAGPTPDFVRTQSDYVVHLSDLHFGADHGFPRSREPGREPVIARIKEDLNIICDGRPGLVIISGDLTTKADANALLIEGGEFLNQIEQELRVPKEAILVIPGNHDFRLSEYRPTDYSHERPFNLMLKNFYGDYDPDNKFRYFNFPSGRMAEFLLINSVRLRQLEESNYGYVEWVLYESRLRTMSHDPEITRIALLHHHLISVPREESVDRQYPHAGISTTLDSGAVIEGLQAHGFRLALHGHQHVPGLTRVSRGIMAGGEVGMNNFSSDLVTLSAGSAGARTERLTDAIRDNSYNILKMTRDEIQIDARRFNPGLPASRHFFARLQLR